MKLPGKKTDLRRYITVQSDSVTIEKPRKFRAGTAIGMRNKGRTQFLSADMSAKVGETDFSIYNKFGGYRRGQNTKKLSKE